ncbi:protein commissureless 2 homolog isoform X1 [Agrilus planipennis]|uniref:Protein commissureless 2 homolog isoform X1 n=1 Tax=Agrilus planipennis TaxID=224129 RepID=A0A1W4WHV5_AGRPL|nr:protein commissureless 2 homolog isoform X1 [Agrilus planipennis]
MESGLLFSMPNRALDLGPVDAKNESFSKILTDEVTAETDPQYEQFLTDVWVGLVLTFMVLSCICCMCSCLLYHKFQQWKRHIIQARNAANVEAGSNYESESLPSYTVVSGLPTYDEALEQLKKMKEKLRTDSRVVDSNPQPCTTHVPSNQIVSRLSVTDLFQLYKSSPRPETVFHKT